MAPKRNYTKEQMARAIEEVNRGVKVAVAATKFGVPRITLRNKVTGKSPIDCTLGPDTILSKAEEKLLVEWLFLMSDNHFPVTKDHLLDSVQKLIIEKNLQHCPFKDNRPGKKWFASFLKRHPEISERTAQNLTKARDAVTEDDLNEWFETNKKYIDERGLQDVLSDPIRIFNTDESAFYLQPKTGKVLVRKGEKNVYNTAGDDKENLTVLLTANAAGTIAPPMIVFPYERLPTLIVNSVPEDWVIGRSETGWMCARTFYEYMTNAFNPWLDTNNISKPIVFFLDGHRSHMTLHLAEFCKSNGIEIIALYPNSTHLIQPMDVAVFRPLKVFWKNQVNQWKIEHPEKRLKKEDFTPNLKIALEKVTKDTIKNGFRKSGLYPFGIDYVDLTKLKSHSRAISCTQQHKSDAMLQFMTYLESEIKSIFTPAKLLLFNHLFYMDRSEIVNHLPQEDQSLYFIWAKIKHSLIGVEDVSGVNLPGQTDLNESAILTATTDNNQSAKEPEKLVLSTSQQQTNMESCSEISAEPSISVRTQHIIIDSTAPQNINRLQLISTEYQTPEAIDESTSRINEKELPRVAQLDQQMTPAKNSSSSTLPNPSTSGLTTSGGMIVPSPFKRAIFWPEPDVKKKRLTKERMPSAITSDRWRAYMTKKENEKKKTEEEKVKRAIERKEKRILKEKQLKEKQEKAKEKKKPLKKEIKRKSKAPSSTSEEGEEVEYLESEYDSLEEFGDEVLDMEGQVTVDETYTAMSNSRQSSDSDLENIPFAQMSHKKEEGTYVIIRYEGEYFPGIIENTDQGYFEVNTMTLSKGNTFRWPDTPDKIWYKKDDVIEYIQDPIKINKRGFYKVIEMEKYLPFIS